jgi:DNA-binding MarR family transcriptional regulator
VAKKDGSPMPNEPLPSAIVELGRLVERRMHRALSYHGVTAGQLMALVHIGGCPGISRADLARRLQISPQAAGGLTTQLLEMVLIARTESRPGLAVEFFATDTGLRLLDETAEILENITQEILQCFRPNLAAAMDGGVRHLLARLS